MHFERSLVRLVHLVYNMPAMTLLAGHSAQCSVMSLRTRSLSLAPNRPARSPRMRSCACRAQQQRHKSGKKAGFSMLPWFLAVPAAVAEEVTEQAQGAVEQAQGVLEQGKQAVEQAQQQFQLPSDLQYPSGSGVKIPKELPSASGLEDYISQNPAIVSAGVAVVAIGLLIARLVGQGVTAKKITAAKAFDMLSKDDSITFVDLRSKAELNETGSPDLRSIKRKTISLPYTTVSFPDQQLPCSALIMYDMILLMWTRLAMHIRFRVWQAI